MSREGMMQHWTNYLDWSWYKYLFTDLGDEKWIRFWCRIGGHKCGTIYYNPGGYEPDYHCINCGEDLG